MNHYKVIDILKNGIILGFLFRVIYSLFPPSKEFAIWWFPYHLQLYFIIYIIPIVVLCTLQYCCHKRIKSSGKQAVKFTIRKRVLLSLLSAAIFMIILTWAQEIFAGPLEMIMYYIAVFLTIP